jgi:eukaryotic-like serine/threonine-protein kinase
MSSTQQLEGVTLHGYQVTEKIHQGSFADIYKGTAPNGDLVAIKVIKLQRLEDQQRKRFQREVIMLQSVRHENIVPIISFGYKEGMFYLIMPFIGNRTLADQIAQKRFSPRDAWQVINSICAALQRGHDRHIVHRDLKPENILVEDKEDNTRYYLADFGLAKRPGIDDTLTAANMTVGTPEYISPEMVTKGQADHLSDIYSMGVIAYELLLGEVPFSGSITVVAMAHAKLAPPSPTEKNSDFPPQLNAFLLKNLSKNKEERHQSMSEFAEAYHRILSTLPESQQNKCFWAG